MRFFFAPVGGCQERFHTTSIDGEAVCIDRYQFTILKDAGGSRHPENGGHPKFSGNVCQMPGSASLLRHHRRRPVQERRPSRQGLRRNQHRATREIQGIAMPAKDDRPAHRPPRHSRLRPPGGSGDPRTSSLRNSRRPPSPPSVCFRGRHCRTKIVPFSSIAHSTSCGEP